MAKFLLIQAKYGTNQIPWIPLAQITLGSALLSKNNEVKVLDRNIDKNDESLLSTLRNFDPDIVGMTSMTGFMLLDIINVAEIVKNNSKAIVVIGGVHATADPESLLDCKFIDYIVRGEGEEVLIEMGSLIDKKKKDFSKLKNVNYNPVRGLINLNDYPAPDYSLIHVKKYPLTIFTTSRGCPGNCTFCYNEYYWNRVVKNKCVRYYDANKTLNMITGVVDKYHIKEFMIVDDMFATMSKRTFDVCEGLSKYNVAFHAYQRVDFTQDEIMKALKKAGCWALQLGVESGSQRMLDFIQKNVTVQQNADAIKQCKKYGIFVDAAFMIGLPTEKKEDVDQTAEFIRKNKPDAFNINIFMPYPGSSLFEYCLKKKLITRPETIEEWKKFFSKKTGDINVSDVPTEYLMKILKEFSKKDSLTYLKKTYRMLSSGHYRFVVSKSKNILMRKLKLTDAYW
ncbi:MAG: radical SAM protein [Candidatus Pacearchaeota archaeon]|jgi:radical SAM superfamily enzyme YgiQ (UPF0313 family)